MSLIPENILKEITQKQINFVHKTLLEKGINIPKEKINQEVVRKEFEASDEYYEYWYKGKFICSEILLVEIADEGLQIRQNLSDEQQAILTANLSPAQNN